MTSQNSDRIELARRRGYYQYRVRMLNAASVVATIFVALLLFALFAVA